MSSGTLPPSLSRRHWLTLCGAALPFAALGQNRIDIEKFGGPAPIPLAVVGYSGEVGETLRFDLEVAGCKIVGEADGQFVLSGSNGAQVEGRLRDRGGSVLLGRAYNRGTSRQQAHALADDVIKALGGQGVAQTRIAFKCEVSQGKSEIYVADYDGNDARKVTSDGAIVAAPTWVPGKLALLYTSYRLGILIFLSTTSPPDLDVRSRVEPDSTPRPRCHRMVRRSP
jgi:hypothetical protein